MSIKKDSLQMSFGDLSAQRILDKCRDHPLLQIKREFSFEQFRDILTPLYSDTGRPAYDPVKMLRLLALGKLHNLSDEMLEFSVLTNILYRAFCGFGLDEDTPDHSTISRFRDRLMPVLVDKLRYLPDAITGDRAYNSVSNSLFLRLRGVEDKTIPRHPRRGRKPRAHKQRKRIERVFSVIKGKFGLARTRFFGLPKVSIEFGLAAFAFNLVNILSIRGSPV